MHGQTRVRLLVAAAAVVVAAGTVGATLLYGDAGGATRAREGAPPLLLDLGVRKDAAARALREAAALYGRGQRDRAGAIFARYPDEPAAEVGAALARWPRSSTRMLEALARGLPRNALVRLHLGLARYWEGDVAAAAAAWSEAERVQPDSPSAIRAEDFLHPQFAPGRPTFVPAGRGSPVARLLRRGSMLQRLGRPLSARRVFDAAVRRAPDDPEALVAAAVARFDKDEPALAFGRLGPLTRRFPAAPTVRFHLGLLLLWTGRVDEGKRQLGLVRGGPLAMEAKAFLVRLANVK